MTIHTHTYLYTLSAMYLGYILTAIPPPSICARSWHQGLWVVETGSNLAMSQALTLPGAATNQWGFL